MLVSIIVAVSENGVIGRHGELPWRLRADLQRFKRLTMGHPIVMGRKTFESIGRKLPGRTSIVITRQSGYQPEGVLVASSLEDALGLAVASQEVFIIGGSEIFQRALPLADRLYLTKVRAQVEGDVRFPPMNRALWQLQQEEHFSADEENSYPYSFQVFRRQIEPAERS